MMQLDAYSQWMGINVLHIEAGACTLSCLVSKEMLNGFGIAHGGISYALADSALAFASNSHGQQCVSIETSIAHIKPTQLNDTITANCTEIQKGKTIGRYVVNVTNQHNELIARFNGTVFRSEKTW
ncbi:MAG: hotdog fold thioesterase [Fluviicola sp.]|nr:hotdog fold thioesterase [Fluviicola sp.]